MKLLEGNPGRRPLPENEPMPGKGERTPSVPGWLDDEARAIWKQHARGLWELGLLTNADVDALATLCETTALYRTAVEMLKRHGEIFTAESGYTQSSAWVTIRNQALKQMQSLWSEFGMTPAARTRIQVEKPEKEVDPLAELLKKRGG